MFLILRISERNSLVPFELMSVENHQVPGSCDYWNDPTGWNASTIEAIGNTWKAGESALQSNL